MVPPTPAPTRAIPPGIRDPARRTISSVAIGDRVTFTQYSTEVPLGNVFTVRATVQPGGGVPLHYHRQCTERFKGLRGVLTVVNGAETLRLGPGEGALVEVGVTHCFRNDSEEEAEFGVTCTLLPGVDPKVLLGFQQSVYIFYGLANDGLCGEDAKPKSVVHAAVALRLGDFMFAGGLGYRIFMGGLFGVADWVGWLTGVEEELLQRYWD